MSTPRIDDSTLHDFYVGDEGGLWRVLTYCQYPTATLERVFPSATAQEVLGARNRIGGAIGAPIFEGFRRLVPEGES